MDLPPFPPETVSAAYASISSELEALSPAEVVPLNVDVARAAARVLGAVPRIKQMIPEVREQLPHLPIEPLVRLDVYALAAWYAYACAWRAKHVSATKDLAAAAKPLRAKLLRAADLLMHAGLLRPEPLERIRGGQGRIDMAEDLLALGALLDAAWPTIGTTTLITRIDLDNAVRLGPELLNAYVHGEKAIAQQRALATVHCARALTLLVRAYSVARRAVYFLRWDQGDAEAIAPSLYSNRGGTGRGGRNSPPTEDAQPPPG